MASAPTTNDSVLRRIRALLDHAGIAYRQLEHEPTHTSAESARARGQPLEVGGKALLLKIDATFRLFVLSAARKLDSGALKRHFGTHHTRFATTTELAELTGLVPGAVPPFGPPILPFELYVDESIVKNTIIAFNAGALTTSLIFAVPDYLRVAQPTVLQFSSS